MLALLPEVLLPHPAGGRSPPCSSEDPVVTPEQLQVLTSELQAAGADWRLSGYGDRGATAGERVGLSARATADQLGHWRSDRASPEARTWP